ncbi:PREDICTED: putative FBD-associated F-box protein At5g56700 isoform X2 [Fragaria vesca subsp. vesca]|uniref:putative FBD-associated F-box protein At5g56700 isoform X2 n=1 Tax=Fragaria vesca subsp. vesca TaxID=101020 RepID=UPI0002C2F52A|nr:PREDICTED: putative FBD-associated F-box protein At5g56700 isoform X2 [Fragaria vesca subsp. vesca]
MICKIGMKPRINICRRRGRQSSQDKDGDCCLVKRKRRRLMNNLDDRISDSPCEILVNVLSLLPLKEAAGTSVLSRRWRRVWESTMKLNFDASNYVAGTNDQGFVLNFMHLEDKLKDENMDNYVSWVNRVLERHRGSKIRQFRACFFLGFQHSNTIDEWIRFAVEKSVEVLELDFSPGTSLPLDAKGTVPCYQKDGFSQYLLCLDKQSALGQQSSDIPKLSSRVRDARFMTLKVLHLRNVGVTGEVLEYLLSNCPVLERLTVSVSKNLVSLRVVDPSIALKYLMIENCTNIERIEIRDVNIVSFSYVGYCVIELLLSNLSMLVDVSLVKLMYITECVIHAFTQLSSFVSQIQFLTLDTKGEMYQDVTFPTFANLKYLELIVCAQDDWSLHQLSSFLTASPYLARLVLKLFYMTYFKPGELKEVIGCHHHKLKDVEIIGYRGITCAIQHVNYLIENAVALKKLVINPMQLRRLPPSVDREIELSKVEENARDHTKQHLVPKLNVSSTVEFVCL